MEVKRIGIDVPVDVWEEIGVIARREHRPIKQIGLELFTKYAKEHGDGNPNFTLDQFDRQEMKAVPAVFRSLDEWQEYIHNLNETDFRELESQIYAVKNKLDAKWKKGF